MMFFRQWRNEDGFAIITLLLIISVSSAVIVGGSSTAASVLNKQDITESTLYMRDVAGVIRDRGTDIGGDQGAALRGHARRMTKIANLMDDQAMDEIVSNAVDNAGDALLTPLQGGKIIQGAQFLWDLKGDIQLADTTMNAWGASDPAADQAIVELQALKPAIDYDDPVEQAIVEAKLTATRNAIETTDLGLSPAEIEDIVVPTLVDIETDNEPPPVTTGPFSNPFWLEAAEYVGVPDLPATPPPPDDTTTTTAATTTTTMAPTVIDGHAMLLTWVYEELDEPYVRITFRIENISDFPIRGIGFQWLTVPIEEHWTGDGPAPPGGQFALDPGETVEGQLTYNIDYWGAPSWERAIGSAELPDDLQWVESNAVNFRNGSTVYP